MLILGIDPGSIRTGYGFVSQERGRLHFRQCGLIRPPRGRALPERLYALHEGLRDLLRGLRPDLVAIEESFVGRHARSALVLGHARGALIVAALSEGVPLAEYAPRLIKLAVTGVGSASKEQMKTMVRRIAVGTPEQIGHDEADALAVAICHAHRTRLPEAAGRRVAVLRGI